MVMKIVAKAKRKYALSKARATARNCLECAGDSAKDVTLCHVFDCPLWEWRLGTHCSGKGPRSRVRRAIEANPDLMAEMKAMGVETSRFCS